jgi:autotransporter-associated beta strand protein
MTIVKSHVCGIAVTLGAVAHAQTTVYQTASGTTQEIATVISGAGGVSVNPAASGGGTVKLTAPNTYTGPTTLGCGML